MTVGVSFDTFIHMDPLTDHSESKAVSWKKAESKDLTIIEFSILTEHGTVSCFFVLLLDSGMKSCHLVPLPLTCVECSCFLSPGLLVALRAALVLQKLRKQGTEKW